MKELKRQARELANDILEQHCEPCTKKTEMGFKDNDPFGRDYCNVRCAVGRDLKRLGEFLDKPKGDKVVKVKVKPVQQIAATKENCVKLLAEGKKNSEIAEIFGISEPNLYYKKNTWGLSKPKKEKPKKEVIKLDRDFKPVEMPVIQPDYSREIQKYEEQVFNLEQSVKDLTKKLEEVGEGEKTNKILYQQNAELKQFLKGKENVILGLFEDYKALERKYEALTAYTKEIM
jgi:hypothetical protein